MRTPTALRATTAGALSGMSVALSTVAKVLDFGAQRLRPQQPAQSQTVPTGPAPTGSASPDATAPPEPAAPVVAADVPGRTEQAPAAPVDADVPELLDEGGHLRTYESAVAELAERPVADVLRAIAEMSTEELEQLVDYEQAHRKRKTVLAAIERSLAPSDVETVHSTETPPTQTSPEEAPPG